ncbi:thioesterase II family protein [Bacillus pseudomycoides]|uniref:thioesterase II family protein n=1 Tax=Bacillus pseudomycoides TaxID=64104 RepID=UPI00211D826C|nr:thioesterase domain-containing protein [Bacillus pseudomycoides]
MEITFNYKKKGKIMNLICLPYAGGSASIFNTWNEFLSPEINVCGIELAGRGRRFQENLHMNIMGIVEDIYNDIYQKIDNSPYSIFGHSMGGLIAYELGQKIQEEGRRMPELFVFSGKSAPQFKSKEVVHKYNDEQLCEKILRLGGTPAEVLDNKELLDIYLPIIRADYKIVETYSLSDQRQALDVPFHVFYGNQDNILLSEILLWKDHTSKTCDFYEFDGGHFFIKQKESLVIDLLNQLLVRNL